MPAAAPGVDTDDEAELAAVVEVVPLTEDETETAAAASSSVATVSPAVTMAGVAGAAPSVDSSD